ncbi:hypothetical protein ACIGO9_30425 [Nocardia asteroides]|uniref:hypothetical protein n=1 Tax=Nocardia asteroides TaxID=1824 RepID=UPI0037CAFA2A
MNSLTESPADRAAAYRQVFGSFVQFDNNRINLIAGPVHAVQVCPKLAEPMSEHLRRRGIATPVIDNVQTGWRTFLTSAPSRCDEHPVQFYLPGSDLRAARTVDGTPIPLPTPDDPCRIWRAGPWTVTPALFDRVADLAAAAVRIPPRRAA